MDGVDTGSASLPERLKFFVHQRRLLLDAVKTKALLLASMGSSEAAAEAAKQYLSMAVPVSQETELERAASRDNLMKEVMAMGPLSVQSKDGHIIATPPTAAELAARMAPLPANPPPPLRAPRQDVAARAARPPARTGNFALEPEPIVGRHPGEPIPKKRIDKPLPTLKPKRSK